MGVGHGTDATADGSARGPPTPYARCMPTSAPEPFDDDLDNVELSDEWVNEARKREDSADSRVARYTQINQAHQTARPPRAWTPAKGPATSTGPATWVKVTAGVLIVVAAAGVLAMLRAWG